jgi:hypothetical protein
VSDHETVQILLFPADLSAQWLSERSVQIIRIFSNLEKPTKNANAFGGANLQFSGSL